MAQRFRGEFSQKIDGKGRMSIPAGLRRVLESGDPDYPEKRDTPRMVVLYGPHLNHNLHAYTIDEMARVADDIDALPMGSDEQEQASRMILSKSLEIEIDRDGRIVLPQARREQIALGKEGDILVLAAMGRYFEIWKESTFNEVSAAQSEAYLASKPDNFNPMSLLAGVRTKGNGGE